MNNTDLAICIGQTLGFALCLAALALVATLLVAFTLAALSGAGEGSGEEDES
jgi:hypothetical protein